MPFGIFDYHTTHKILHVNCEKPRAYFVPFSNEGEARDGVREYSEYFKTLIGEWDFKFYNNLFDLSEITIFILKFSSALCTFFLWSFWFLSVWGSTLSGKRFSSNI